MSILKYVDFTNAFSNMHPHHPICLGCSRRVSLLDRLSATRDPSSTDMPHVSPSLGISPGPSLEPSLGFHAAPSHELGAASGLDPGHDPGLTVGKSLDSDLPSPCLSNDTDGQTAGPMHPPSTNGKSLCVVLPVSNVLVPSRTHVPHRRPRPKRLVLPCTDNTQVS